LSLRLVRGGDSGPVPKAWLDQFFMRSFTGFSAFDQTLPAGDGVLEAGLDVDTAEVGRQFEKWLRGRKMIDADTELRVTASEPPCSR
jgi:hypothetical protein